MEHSDIVNKMARFYRNLFTTSLLSNLNPILNVIFVLVDNSNNDMLIREVTYDEIKDATFDMHPIRDQE